DEVGRPLVAETDVYNGNGYEKVDWSVRYYPDVGRSFYLHLPDGTQANIQYDCCTFSQATDVTGIVTTTNTDGRGLLLSRTMDSVQTTYEYDWAERPVLATLRDHTQTGPSLTVHRAYDALGRTTSQTDPAGLMTTFDYWI